MQEDGYLCFFMPPLPGLDHVCVDPRLEFNGKLPMTYNEAEEDMDMDVGQDAS
jgi:hypothetical protein